MERTVPVHWLRGNASEWSPRRVAFFDTECWKREETDRELLVFRLWCAMVVDRGGGHGGSVGGSRGDGTEKRELADWLTSCCIGVSSVWAYAHNLAFDVAAARLLDHLAAIGWRLNSFSVTDANPWFRLTRGAKRLTLVDSWSWLPAALAAVGDLAGVPKPALPDWDDTDTAWMARCRGDVESTAAAVCQLMDWWDREKLGRWSVTGAATGWNAMRHRTRHRSWLIDPDPEARAFERMAVRGGRRDVWRAGTFRSGPYAMLDIERAHATIAEHCLLPSRRLGRFDRLAQDDPMWSHAGMGAIAWCLVTTDVPRYAVELTDTQWWPTGTFWTVLAWPEMRAARDRGELVEVGSGWRYTLTTAMQPWGAWVNGLAGGEDPAAPRVAQLAAKSWGRAVVGKFGAHSASVERIGMALSPHLHAEEGWSVATGTRMTLLDLGDDRWKITHDTDAENCFPAVLAWVESELRVRMARIIDRLGPSVVVQCDTDGVIVDLTRSLHAHIAPSGRRNLAKSPARIGQRLCEWLAPDIEPLSIRVKELYPAITITGPQQLTLAGQRKFSGIVKGAKAQGDGSFVGRPWPKLRWQLAHGDPEGYVRPTWVFRPRGGYIRRWVCTTGTVIPPAARACGHEKTELVKWADLGGHLGPDVLCEVQHPVLEGLR